MSKQLPFLNFVGRNMAQATFETDLPLAAFSANTRLATRDGLNLPCERAPTDSGRVLVHVLLPVAMADGATHAVRLEDGRGVALTGVANITLPSPQDPLELRGIVGEPRLVADGILLRGFAVNWMRSTERQVVEILLGDRLVAVLKAELPRPDLAQIVGGDTLHGFAVSLTGPWWKLGREVHVRFAGGGALRGSPIQLPQLGGTEDAPVQPRSHGDHTELALAPHVPQALALAERAAASGEKLLGDLAGGGGVGEAELRRFRNEILMLRELLPHLPRSATATGGMPLLPNVADILSVAGAPQSRAVAVRLDAEAKVADVIAPLSAAAAHDFILVYDGLNMVSTALAGEVTRLVAGNRLCGAAGIALEDGLATGPAPRAMRWVAPGLVVFAGADLTAVLPRLGPPEASAWPALGSALGALGRLSLLAPDGRLARPPLHGGLSAAQPTQAQPRNWMGGTSLLMAPSSLYAHEGPLFALLLRRTMQHALAGYRAAVVLEPEASPRLVSRLTEEGIEVIFDLSDPDGVSDRMLSRPAFLHMLMAEGSAPASPANVPILRERLSGEIGADEFGTAALPMPGFDKLSARELRLLVRAGLVPRCPRPSATAVEMLLRRPTGIDPWGLDDLASPPVAPAPAGLLLAVALSGLERGLALVTDDPDLAAEANAFGLQLPLPGAMSADAIRELQEPWHRASSLTGAAVDALSERLLGFHVE